MEFKFRAIDEKPPTYIPRLPPPHPPPTSISYFTEQAIRVGYSGPNFAGHTTEYFRNPNGVREAIQREIEKERIRDEIIAAEIARKRMLEAEVRREMMVEREWALRRGGGAGGGGFPTMMFEQPRLSIEDRIALSLEERLGGGVHHACRGVGIGGFETAPFQRSAEPKITEVTATQLEVSKEKVIFVAKPEGNLSGSKRKAVTPPAAGATETTPPVGSKKKTKEEWSCAICQVSATSERGLNEHLQGKKHKSKEAGLRAQKTGKNYAIGLFPKKNAKPIKIVEPTSNQNSEQGEKANTEDVKQNNDLALVVFKDTGDSKNENGNSPQKMHQKNGELVKDKNRFKFWCEMCQIGAFSEKVMNKHRKGKKHMGRLLSSVLGGQVEEDPQKGSAADLVEKDGKEEKLENVAADGDAVENHKAADQNGDVKEKGCDVQKMMERMEPLNM